MGGLKSGKFGLDFWPYRHKVDIKKKSNTVDVSVQFLLHWLGFTFIFYTIHFPDFLVLCIDIYHTKELCLCVTRSVYSSVPCFRLLTIALSGTVLIWRISGEEKFNYRNNLSRRQPDRLKCGQRGAKNITITATSGLYMLLLAVFGQRQIEVGRVIQLSTLIRYRTGWKKRYLLKQKIVADRGKLSGR